MTRKIVHESSQRDLRHASGLFLALNLDRHFPIDLIAAFDLRDAQQVHHEPNSPSGRHGIHEAQLIDPVVDAHIELLLEFESLPKQMGKE